MDDAELVGRQLHLAAPSALRSRGRRIWTWRPPRVTSPASLPWRTGDAVGVVAAPLAGEGGGLGVEDHVEHLEPGADDEGEQALLELAGQLGDGDGDGVGQRDGRLRALAERVGPGLLRGRAPSARRGSWSDSSSSDGPLLDRCLLTDARDLPPGRHQAGDRHLNSHAQRDNLSMRADNSSRIGCQGPHPRGLTSKFG